jgi:uncharacterized protein (UPF0262 family)
MTNKMVFLVASAWEAAVIASALPLSPLESDSDVDQVRMVCDEYGSCWRESSPAEDITSGVIEGLEGRSICSEVGIIFRRLRHSHGKHPIPNGW